MQDNDIGSGIKSPTNTRKLLFLQYLSSSGLLVIDGGGTRGIIPATIIEFLEQKSGKNFWELFDFAAGL